MTKTIFAPLAWIYDRREDLIIDFKNHFNVSTTGVLNASLLGNRYFLDKQTAEIFREGGTFHVLVISGLHITFIGGLILLFVQIFYAEKILAVFDRRCDFCGLMPLRSARMCRLFAPR